MENVDITPNIALFNDFFMQVYRQKIDELLLVYPARCSLNVDYRDLEKFDSDLADWLIKNPDLGIDAAEQAIKQLNMALPSGSGPFEPHVRFFSLPIGELLIEQLSSKEIGTLVAFKGVVTKRTEMMHRAKVVVYRCEVCDEEMRVHVTKNFAAPKKCPSCKKLALKQIEEDSKFVDIQRGEVQELLERVRGGTPAAKMELLMEDDLVNVLTPGENVELTGVLRIKPSIKGKSRQELIYTRYVEVNHIKSMKRDFEEIDINKEDERRILEFARNPNIERIIVNSLGASIYGHDEVKRAMALQLFGGTKGKKNKSGAVMRDVIHVLLIGDPGLAKCTDGDTKVLLADGSVQKIRDIVESVLKERGGQKVEDGVYATSNHDLLSLNLDGKIEESKATHFWKLEAPQYLYEIETRTGKKVNVTPEHPFFVSANGYVGSVPAKELAEGGFIATPGYIRIEGKPQRLPIPEAGKTNATRVRLPEVLTAEFSRLLGYLTGDGYIRRTTSYEISLTNNDEFLIKDFSRILESFGLQSRIKTDKRNGVRTAFTFSVELGRVLESLGMTNNSFNKSIPQPVMKSSDEVAKEFIKSYFDCEASVGEDGITVVSASRELLEGIQLLLLRFGIVGILHETYSRATNAKNHAKTKYHRLFILGENAAKYGKLISFTSEKKAAKLAKLGKKFNTNIDVIPNLKSILTETRRGLGLSQFRCGIPRSTYQHFERGDRNPSYPTLRRIVKAFKDAGRREESASLLTNIRLLALLSESQIFWDRVKSIRKVKPKEKWVYDLQVDPTHNFIANNMIVHNTRFLQEAADIAPKSIYVSGKTVSSVGLTVAAEKDDLGEGGWTLKAGALVLASGGLAALDEFDKIEDEDRAALHEVMESQRVSIAKAGFVAQFSAKCSIIAAANPKHGRFDLKKNLADQFDVPPTLLSRFDLIFPIIDVLDREKDTKLAQYILETHMGKFSEEATGEMEKELLRKYIAYARRMIVPKLEKDAMEKIKEFYVDMRGMGKDHGSVSITPRYLEGLVRLAEANAKMRLSPVVEGRDAEVAVDLMKYVMRQIMTDKATGMFDVDTVATGKPKSERDRLQKVEVILDIISQILKNEDAAEVERVIEEAASYEIDKQTARHIIDELLRKGALYEKEHGHVRMVEGRG